MLFNLRNLLPELACVLAIGHIVASAPHGDPLSIDQGLEKRVNTPKGMKYNERSGAYTVVKKRTEAMPWEDQKQGTERAKMDSELFFRSFIAANPTRDQLLISALYVPSKGIFVSSYPKQQLPSDQAPAWASAVNGRIHKKMGKTQHAEDGALWLYEATLAADKKPKESGKYPAGSTIFTYGQYANQKAANVKACGSQKDSSLLVPSCTDVLSILGIKDGNNPLHNP